MEFFNSAVDTLQTIVVGLGGALCVWGGVNLLEGYGADNPASKSQGIKQLMAGAGVAGTNNEYKRSEFKKFCIKFYM